jgi:CheY-like chemotaxis protein
MNAPAQKTALIVEDEASTLRFYMSGLRGLQEFRLLSAMNGREAIEALKDNAVDLVVTDLNMPVMDGYTLIAVLAERFPSLPVIVITSVADTILQDQALRLGALQVIPKPAKLSFLMETMRAAVNRPPAGMVRGLGLSSILQLMNWEKRTATLTVRGPGGTGYLYVREGELVHAALGREEGLAAAYRLLDWEGPQVEFVYACKVRSTIDLPITEILMNQAMIRDTQALPPSKPPEDHWRG